MTAILKLLIKIVIGAAGREDRLLPERRLIKIGKDKADGRQWQQITKAAACLSHLKFVLSQVNYVSLDKHGNSKKPDRSLADLRGEQLKLHGNDCLQGERQREGQHKRTLAAQTRIGPVPKMTTAIPSKSG